MSKEELNQVIVKWFTNAELYGVYEYYLDSNDWFENTEAVLSHVMFNNRFLNLIQGLKAYFNAFYPTKQPVSAAEQQQCNRNKKMLSDLIKDDKLKEWFEQSIKPKKARELTLKEKLTRLIADLEPDMQGVFQNVSLSEFPQTASKFRNQLSHGIYAQIDLGERMHEDYFIAQVLLGTCILRSLGVTGLNKRIAYYSRFQDAAYQVAHFQKRRKQSLSMDSN